MKHLKIFEYNYDNFHPMINDFVLISFWGGWHGASKSNTINRPPSDSLGVPEELYDFLSNNIVGKIVNIYKDEKKSGDLRIFDVQYNYSEIPLNLKKHFNKDGDKAFLNFFPINYHDIKYWSENISDVEEIVAANKYNL
jgi:hypothetical protein